MAQSSRWLTWVFVSCYTLSGCAFLPIAETESAEGGNETIATVDETAAAESETTTSAHTEQTEKLATATTAEKAAVAKTNYFSEGVTRAQSAVAIGQSAQSTDDWDLAASRWQQAIAYMQQVPASDPNHATAQQKIQEYQKNLTLVQRRAAGEVPQTNTAAADRPPGLVASIPVVDQMGGTPVVPVKLTGNRSSQQFTMLFDTGASGTLITQTMANAIGVVVVDTAIVTVADGRQVEIPIGYVDTLEVGGLVVRDLVVGIGGDVALLGQDVYGQYGLSIGGNKIDLYQ